MTRLTTYLGITLAAAASWSVTVGAHELVGHGGGCLIIEGCTGRYADAMYFDFAFDGDELGRAIILIGGPLASFAVGLVGLVLRLGLKRSRPGLDWLAWALIPAGWISGGAYVAFGQFIHPGMDTAQLARMGGDNASVIITIIGSASILLGVIASALLMPVKIPKWSRPLVVLAAVLGYALSALGAAYFVPGEREFLMMGAFGASVLFTTALWIAALPWPTLRPRQTNGRLGILVSLVLLALTGGYVFILGPGISFGAGG